ncbi:glycosyltransferase family 39 protein [Solwaraspora sp. WMMD1047]|uniref:dolichyl-phosphate-mannose--protein mannosyltransferase n=1 Tax=Solwaraspora sp. WMMD1047 TaxID=3016102 RepID=UPI003241DD14
MLPAAVRRRLAPIDSRLDPWSWLATGVIVAIAAILRLVGITHPKGKIFDEVYYATDAHNLLIHGVEWNQENTGPAYVVHPPLGKWMIALGEQLFGYNELGWRFGAAMAGTISVLLLIRIARRMFRSTVLGCTAGLLLALDGFHLVLSRTALLDIFVMFFVLAAFGALVLDRDARRRRWLRALEAGLDPTRPGREGRIAVRFADWVPWWRLATAVLLGCAIGVKWSAAFFIPVFALLVIIWEVGARRSAGVPRPWWATLRAETGWLVLAGVLMLATYIMTWSGWLFTDVGYYRHFRADQGLSEPPVIGALWNLYEYHSAALGFHTTLDTEHTYQSWPWQWLLLARPVAFHWTTEGACGAASCAEEILLLGTPILWWSFLPALAALAWLGIARRDWRAGTIWLMVAAGLGPWFYFALDDRTMFSFYAAPALPFLVLAVTYVLGAILGPARTPVPAAVGSGGASGSDGSDGASGSDGSDGASGSDGSDGASGSDRAGPAAGEGTGPAAARAAQESDRRLVGAVIVGAYVLLVAICFGYFYPIFVGQLMDYADWSARMWLGSRWI